MMGIKRILIIRTDRLGDLLMNYPLIRRLRQNFKDAHITVLCHPRNRDLMEMNPDADRVLTFDSDAAKGLKGLQTLSRLIHEGRYGAVIISNPNKLSHWASFVSGVPIRVGFDHKWSFCLNQKTEDIKFQNLKHEIDYNLELVDSICPLKWDGSMDLGAESPRHKAALWEQWGLGALKTVVFHVKTSNPAKEWPLKKFGQVIQRILGKRDTQVVLVGTGDAGEINLSLGISDHERLYNLAGRTSVVDLARLLGSADLLVSLDSGPFHLAWMQKTPVIGLFVKNDPGSHPRRWGVYPDFALNTQIFERSEDIAPEQVFRVVESHLGAAEKV